MTQPPAPEALLLTWLTTQDTPQQAERFRVLVATVRNDPSRRNLFRTLALASRAAGKGPLHLDAHDCRRAQQSVPGWRPDLWQRNHAARILILLQAAQRLPADDFQRELGFLFDAADVGELESLYQALPLFPQPHRLLHRAHEASRSNMTTLFTALAWHNPYPATHFDEASWNQMILKAVFLGLALAPIQRLDQRANPRLAAMLLDYVRERWAARRPVPWDLWRCVGPYVETGPEMAIFQRLLTRGGDKERAAAGLSLKHNPHPEFRRLLVSHPLPAGSPDSWQAMAAMAEQEARAHRDGWP